MRVLFTIFLLLAVNAAMSQTTLEKVVATEHAFAALAAEKGTKAAFLANITDDAVIFNPEKLNAKALWTSRGESKSLLSWMPNFADISQDGSVGYTTGNWEFRRTNTDEPAAFGEFITVWVRQPDGKYKFVIDIGVGHEKPSEYSTDWITTKPKTDANKRNISADDSISRFTETVTKKGLAAALKTYAADDIRLYREEKSPFFGKTAAITQAGAEKGTLTFKSAGNVTTAGNLAFFGNEYMFVDVNKKTESGNAVQIWKFIGGKWKIVLDILKPVPAK